MDRPVYVGLDLGTTNSAVATFDGERVDVVRSGQGGVLTPSVVRFGRNGLPVVGARARRFLERDPDNTRSEFKRLMGTDEAVAFPAAGVAKSPEELAALVIAALCGDVEQALGFRPLRAVVTVPALFEVPQSAATARAAALAGLERVELLQEPVASALAAGWSAEASAGPWLVYDLGGGTFDVSLLDSRHGLLRVVGHDGDNFLGGRDVDRAIVDWAIDRIAAQDDVRIDRGDPTHAGALRQLALAAEEAKIELSRADSAAMTLATPMEVGDAEVDVDLALDRATFEALARPLVERSLQVCERLLAEHGVRRDELERIVLVGGPTVMPALREAVRDRLGPLAAEHLDPMTLVAQGAALYAASAGLDARPSRPPSAETGVRVRLQFPTMTSDLTPFVVGRLANPQVEPRPMRVRLTRGDWRGDWSPIGADGAFAVAAELERRRANDLLLEAQDATGAPVALAPRAITIVHGVAITDPPLSRTIGVALANDGVRIYFERGMPLPAKRTFVHHTVETVGPGDPALLHIPIVQGELDQAHLCRLVGTLQIPGEDLDRVLPVGSPVEITLELDRGGHLSARAVIPGTGQAFEEVAHLLVPEATPDVLDTSVQELAERASALKVRLSDPEQQMRLMVAGGMLDDIRRSVAASRGGDTDAGQRARRLLLETEAEIAALEAERHWPELEERALERVVAASSWVSELGSPAERDMLDRALRGVEQARSRRSAADLQRQLRMVQRLGNTAYFRHPQAWRWSFDEAASRAHEANDLRRAEALVARGRQATPEELRPIVQELWSLLPVEANERRKSYMSGVR